MRQYFDRRFLGLGGILAIGLLAFTGIASGTSSAAKPNIYWACVPHNGNIRLVFPGTTCKKGVRLIKWYQSPSVGTNGGTGPAGPTGPIGPAGAPGISGLHGTAGANGSQGTAGTNGSPGTPGTDGSPGTPGADGSPGTPGTDGSPGTPGADGAPGSNGVSAYAYYYNVGAANVAVGAAVPFDTNGISSPGFTHAVGASAVTLVDAGVYKVSFIVSATEANQMAVFLNLTVVAGGIYGSGAGTQQNSGQVIIQANAGDVLTLRNHTSAAVVGLQAAAGGSAASVNASVSIEKLS
jgi:hypothetical protein